MTGWKPILPSVGGIDRGGQDVDTGGQVSTQAARPQRDTPQGCADHLTEVVSSATLAGQTKSKKYAKRDPEELNIREMDPGLQTVVEGWDSLPDSIKNAIVGMVESQ
jgi:hypothetical protein